MQTLVCAYGIAQDWFMPGGRVHMSDPDFLYLLAASYDNVEDARADFAAAARCGTAESERLTGDLLPRGRLGRRIVNYQVPAGALARSGHALPFLP